MTMPPPTPVVPLLRPQLRHVVSGTNPLRPSIRLPLTAPPQQLKRALLRQFNSYPPLCKLKGGKQESKRTVEKARATVEASGSDDPADFGHLEAQILHAQARMKDDLSKLRSGGRFNHELLEGLRVKLGKGKNDTAKLGDLAQVVPRQARMIHVLVGDQEHVKQVSAAILGSPYSLNPIPNPHNPLELQITIPPPTTESRHKVLEEADKAAEYTYHSIRQARGAQQKKLNAMEKARTVRPDALHKARQRMEKIIEAANEETKTILEKAKKALQV